MQIRFQLNLFANRFFIINYVTLIMAQDAPKRQFLSLIFLVSYYYYYYYYYYYVVQFMIQNFFPKGRVQTMNLGFLRIALSWLSLELIERVGPSVKYRLFPTMLSFEFPGG